MFLRVERNVQVGSMRSPPAAPIREHAGGSARNISAEIVDWLLIIASDDTREYVLDEVVDLFLLSYPVAKIAD